MPPTRQVGQFWRAAVLSLMPSSRASAARGCNISPFGSSMAGRSSLVSRCGDGAKVPMSVTVALPSTKFRQGQDKRRPLSDNMAATDVFQQDRRAASDLIFWQQTTHHVQGVVRR